MKKFLFTLVLFAVLLFTGMTDTVFADGPGPPPPPPLHAQNGNQVSPGGTGCPIDRQDGIIIAVLVTLAYAGFVLFRRGKFSKNTKEKAE